MSDTITKHARPRAEAESARPKCELCDQLCASVLSWFIYAARKLYQGCEVTYCESGHCVMCVIEIAQYQASQRYGNQCTVGRSVNRMCGVAYGVAVSGMGSVLCHRDVCRLAISLPIEETRKQA